jgi:membrane-bound ClpP family serine protease
MKKNNSQVINSILILTGGALLIFEISGGKENVYFLIAGIILLMFGLYRATNHWVETKDDHKQGEESEDELL